MIPRPPAPAPREDPLGAMIPREMSGPIVTPSAPERKTDGARPDPDDCGMVLESRLMARVGCPMGISTQARHPDPREIDRPMRWPRFRLRIRTLLLLVALVALAL